MYTVEKFEKTIDIKKYIEGYVNVKEFEEFCKECPNYGKVWSCPPYDFDAEKYWEKFSEISIFAYKINFTEDVSKEESYQILKEVKKTMSEELFQLEEITSGAESLSAGSCHLCQGEGCTRPQGGACRHPQKMRYSIESIGGNVGLTVRKLMGIELEWIDEGKVPSYFVLVGGLLKK